jgi:pimeloyl-ACP methyl ester carboxylesterase
VPWQPPTVVLVHSPFLGPTSLRPLADALAARGTPAVLLDLRVTVAAAPVHARMIGSFADALHEALSETADADSPETDDLTESLVLVGHSGAGPLLPAFADALDEPVVGLVFLDAGLPTPGLSWRDTAPPELYEDMRARSREGLMPAWPYWFSPDPLPRLIPDTVLRAQIAEEAPEVPVAFLKEARPSVGWSGPAAYLQLSGAYDRDMAAARRRGWPVRRLDSNHLAAATEPDLVADALLRLLARLDAPEHDD